MAVYSRTPSPAGPSRLNRAAGRPSCLADRSRKPKPRVLCLAPLRIPLLWCRPRRFACSARTRLDICSSCSRSSGIPRPTRRPPARVMRLRPRSRTSSRRKPSSGGGRIACAPGECRPSPANVRPADRTTAEEPFPPALARRCGRRACRAPEKMGQWLVAPRQSAAIVRRRFRQARSGEPGERIRLRAYEVPPMGYRSYG